MVKWKLPVVVASVGVLGFIAGQAMPVSGTAAAAQPEKKPTKAVPKPAAQPGKNALPAGMEEAMKAEQPGPEHKILECFLGNWEGKVKFWMAPGGDPMETTGTIHREWQLDGHWMVEHVDGASMMPGGKPFKGMGLIGYNTIEKRYEFAWVDNESTHVDISTGSYDAAKKTFTFEANSLNAMTGKREKQKTVADVSNPDREVFTGYAAGPDGKEFKNIEMVFEKKK